MEIKQKFGLAVRNRRRAIGVSQEELGMRINMDGNENTKYADQSYVSKVELGQANVTLETIQVLCDALDCEAGDLFG